MPKYKITGEIEAENEEDARFKATIEGGNGILEFEENVENIKQEVKVNSEVCECGGVAEFDHWDEGDKRIPILKCKLCGDEFEADETSWRE